MVISTILVDDIMYADIDVIRQKELRETGEAQDDRNLLQEIRQKLFDSRSDIQ